MDMAAKKVSFGARPKAKASLEDWVETREVIESSALESQPDSQKQGLKPEKLPDHTVKMKRLTLDISEPLHRAIKSKAVAEGMTMVEMLRDLLDETYG